MGGMMAAVFDRLSQITGLDFKYVTADSYDDTTKRYQGEAEVSATLNTDFSWADQHRSYLTQPFFEAPVFRVTMPGHDGNSIVALPLGYHLSKAVQERLSKSGEGFQYQYFGSVGECLQAVRDGVAGRTYINSLELNYYMSQDRYSMLKLQSVPDFTESTSIGISKAKDRASLLDALELAFEFTRTVLVEPAITSLREINCAVLGDYENAEASECEEPLNAEDILTFQDKYMSGGKGGAKTGAKTADAGAAGGSKSGMASLQRKLPADLTEEQRSTIRKMAVDTFQALGCSGVSRIDFMIDRDTDKIYVNEINTIPGSLSFYLWEPLGISYPQLLDRMIELALKKQREEEKMVFTFESNVLEGIKLGGSKGKLGK